MSDTPQSYPDLLKVRPLDQPPEAEVQVPGSKSITNRALVLAALSQPDLGSQLDGALRSDDTEVMVDALQALGFQLKVDWSQGAVHVRRGAIASRVPAQEANLFTANSGTTMRFLTALSCLGKGHYRLDGIARMRERPIEDLLVALRQLDAKVRCEGRNGFPPVIIDSSGLNGGQVRLKGETSSQFLSALLMVAPFASGEVSIQIDGYLVSQPYAILTVQMMKEFGVDVKTDGFTYFNIPVRPWYESLTYRIEPDASSASYFFGAAAITKGSIEIPGIWARRSLQGDARFIDVLEEMGCHVATDRKSTEVYGALLHGIDIDMNAISDTVMTLAAVACFADGPTTIRNVAHIRHKETDRLAALATELRRVGAEVEEFADGLTITPRPLHGAEIETYNDHRMAMSMALIGLRVPGIVIKNPGCVAKTYPGFWEDLEKLRQSK